MKTLSIDIETYSPTELAKSGVYRYAEDPEFEILLFGYSADDEDVRVIDLAAGEKLPADVLKALTDNSVTKWAFNASFERVCLSRYLRDLQALRPGEFLDPAGWRCTMVWAAYLGLPLSLKDAGAALKLERQKLDEGKDLIRLFCKPCEPTLTNMGRSHNGPQDAPDEWARFKAYNQRDVETEQDIQRRLRNFPVPDTVWDEYHIDQEINDRGIGVDRRLVESAIDLDTQARNELTARMRKLTALDNPNSTAQMKAWLAEHGLETDTLGKKQVQELLRTCTPELRDALVLRQQLAKSSVKKYQAMDASVCDDGRCRGMFQFYGANRSGRWCLTGDHEILTPDGWERLDAWQGGPIACWNATSEAVSFQNAKALVFDYEGPMYTYSDSRIDQTSTPDHKMRVQKRYGDPWQDMTVEEMAKGRPGIPLNGYRYHRGCANPAWLRVLIMTQADGFYTADGSVKFHFKKERKIERCKSLLRKAEIMFVTARYKEVSVITIPARAVPLWLREFRSKTFGFWLLDENPDIFFDELPNWDGYYPAPNSIQYSTCNKQNADIVQALAHMSGRCASMRIKKHSGVNAHWNDAYVLDIWLTPKNCHLIKNKPTISEFKGKVYCAETDTGYFLIRRNGKVWVTGNSGRLVQLQNLPQNHMADLDAARRLVRAGDYDSVKMLYGSVTDVLSELIRTAFVPQAGHKFIVADYSAIEARVIAWLAREQWRMDLFKSGGDIYCQSATQMFKVPVVKHGVNGHLRQRGKVAELACIAEDSPVLTDYGLIPIQEVTTDMKVWDGENWVTHEGVVYRGEREVMTYGGLTATPDHLVWVEGDDRPVRFEYAAAAHRALIHTGEGVLQSCSSRKIQSVYDIRNAGPHHRFTVSNVLVHNCGYGGGVGALKAMGALEMGLKEDELPELVTAWRESNPSIVKLWWSVGEAAMTAIRDKTVTHTHGLTFTCRSGMLFITLPSGRNLSYVMPQIGQNRFGGESITYMGVGATKKWERVESYGPKFVENITQAVSRDVLCGAIKRLRDRRIVAHVHDELIIEADRNDSLEEICELMGRTPVWAEGLILRADGYECEYYQKD